jgi:APA family basic amino acid/polyamine antiporter
VDVRALHFGKLRTTSRLHHLRGLVFYILTIVGLFVLRQTHPNAPRPYKAVGYPVLPIIYIVMALFIDVVLLRYKPQFTWPGLIVVLLGIPVYYAWSRSAGAQRSKSA